MDQSFPDERGRCPKHGFGEYPNSVACIECRKLIKGWLTAQFLRLPKVEAVGFTGSSGAAFGYWLADMLGVKPLHVLKHNEQAHSNHVRGLGYAEEFTRPWVFIDDFVANGSTLRRVTEEIGSAPAVLLLYMWTSDTPQLRQHLTITSRDGETWVRPRAEAILAEPCHPILPESLPPVSLPSALEPAISTQSMQQLSDLSRRISSAQYSTDDLGIPLLMQSFQVKPIEFDYADVTKFIHDETIADP